MPRSRSLLRIFCASALALAGFSSTTHAEFAFHSYSKNIKSADVVGSAGSDMFGDQTNFYTGTTSFSQVDIDIPGNSGLPVRLARRFTQGSGDALPSVGTDHVFGDWDIQVPYLTGVFSRKHGWQVTHPQSADGNGFGGSNRRCSIMTKPASAEGLGSPERGVIISEEYWNGNALMLPQGGSHSLLAASSSSGQKPTDGKTYRWKTSNHWHFSCISAANQSGGEGFEGVAPDGTRYKFNWLTTHDQKPFSRPYGGGGGPLGQANAKDLKDGNANVYKIITMDRVEVRLMVTEVKDRFGNWVRYQYDAANPKRIKRIYANDGRSISFGYDASGRISSASAHGQTWNYQYSGRHLNKVLLPSAGGSRLYWSFNMSQWLGNIRYTHESEYVTPPPGERACKNPGVVATRKLVATMRHPSGASGRFELEPKRHHRSGVQKICYSPDSSQPAAAWISTYPITYDTMALTRKVISGTGAASQVWQINYNAGAPTWRNECGSGCNVTKTTSINEPTGFRRLTFGNKFRDQEGLLLKEEVGNNASSILQTTSYQYDTAQSGKPWPTPMGDNLNEKSDGADDAYLRPMVKRTINRQATNFVLHNKVFDQFANPTTYTESSSLGFSRTKKQTYQHNYSKWVIGLPKESRTNNIIDSNIIYHASSLLPYRTYAFGKLQHTQQWWASGLLRSQADGLNRTTNYQDWKRGIPGTVTYADGSKKRASMDDLGRITQVTDERNKTTRYAYDGLDRLTRITPPDSFTPTNINYKQTTRAEHGLSRGHWKQTRTHGPLTTETYYDALYRPILVRTQDNTFTPMIAPLMETFVRKAYDRGNREVFVSYPQDRIEKVNTGIHTAYDALNRVNRTKQDSERGALYHRHYYYSDFVHRVVNPRGGETTTRYQAFAEPTTNAPVGTTQPENRTTLITRDVFGKPTKIKRHNVTRQLVYDAHQQLCKVIEPESGSTWFGYDAANQMSWRATGTNAALNCSNAPTNTRSTFTYHPRGWMTYARHPSGTYHTSYAYHADGKLRQTVANGSTWQYQYNSLGQPTEQKLTYGGRTLTLRDAYNRHGHHTRRTLPSGLAVDYDPDAFGRPKKAGSFATEVHYHANSALHGFLYGNKFRHALALNARQLPESQIETAPTAITPVNTPGLIFSNGFESGGVVVGDGGGGKTQTIIDHTLTWDQNANLERLHDVVGYESRTNSYDLADRLIRSNATGSHSHNSNELFRYDVLDNLTQKVRNGQTINLNINGSNRLATAKNGTATIASYGYDARGNITARGGFRHSYDLMNRMTSTHAPFSEVYRYDGHNRRTDIIRNGKHHYSMYDLSGKLVYSFDTNSRKCIEYIHLGGRLIAESERTNCGGARRTTYQHLNYLGTPLLTSKPNGQINQAESLTPYGEPYSNNWVKGIGFTGHTTDAQTRLTYMQQRYMDGAGGRFLSVDPIKPSTYDGSNFNRYWYANNNPYKYVDPDGQYGTNLPDKLVSCRETGTCMTLEQASAIRSRDARWIGGGFVGIYGAGATVAVAGEVGAVAGLRQVINSKLFRHLIVAALLQKDPDLDHVKNMKVREVSIQHIVKSRRDIYKVISTLSTAIFSLKILNEKEDYKPEDKQEQHKKEEEKREKERESNHGKH